MDERERLLHTRDPLVLFGSLDPREVRRAYAKLARTWRDDAEVAAHLRAAFDDARQGRPSEPVPGPVTGSPQGGGVDVHARVHRLAFERLGMPQHQLEATIAMVLGPAVVDLSPAERDLVRTVLADPGLSVDERVLADGIQLLSVVDTLERATQEGALPTPILTACRAGLCSPPSECGPVWLAAAQQLDGEDLVALFDGMEREWPALLGLWTDIEAAIQRAAPDPDPEAVPAPLRFRYQSDAATRHGVRDIAWRRVLPWWSPGTSAQSRVPLAFVFAAVAFGSTLLARPSTPVVELTELQLAFALLVALGPPLGLTLWARVTEGLLLRELSDARAAPIADLLELARERTLFPRELAAQLNDLPPLRRHERAYDDGHVVLELDRCPWALLAVISPAHVARLEGA